MELNHAISYKRTVLQGIIEFSCNYFLKLHCSHFRIVLYPILCYKETYYKGTAL